MSEHTDKWLHRIERMVLIEALRSRVLMKRLGFSRWLCTMAAGVDYRQFLA